MGFLRLGGAFERGEKQKATIRKARIGEDKESKARIEKQSENKR